MTAQEDFNTFLAAQAVPGYVLGDIEGTADADMVKYTELKIAVSQEESLVKQKQDYIDYKLQELAVKHNDEKIALGKELDLMAVKDMIIPAQ